MNAARLDELVAGLATVRDESLAGTEASIHAQRLFGRIVATPVERRPRRRRLLVAAVAAAALVVTPALALRDGIVDLFSSREPASPTVNRSFYSLEGGAPERFQISASARKVLEVSTPDGPVVIWAAPREIGFCYAVGTAGHEGSASTCADGTEKIDAWPFSVDKPRDELVGGPFVLVGFTTAEAARSVRLRFEDGTETSVPLTFVSRPIDAGFFVFWSAPAHWSDGKERLEVTARDGSGKDLATSSVEVGVPTG